jgi:small subunit ribosomal protein S35
LSQHGISGSICGGALWLDTGPGLQLQIFGDPSSHRALAAASNHDPTRHSGMASPANILRLCARPSKRLPSLHATALQRSALRRSLSTTQWRSAAAPDDGKDEEESGEVFSNPGQYLKAFLRDENISAKDRELANRMLDDWQKVPRNEAQKLEDRTRTISDLSAELRRPAMAKRKSFWHDEETDTDLITNEIGEDDFEEDDMMAMGHAKLEEHREFREYARIAVWEMPLLSSKPAGAAPTPAPTRRN